MQYFDTKLAAVLATIDAQNYRRPLKEHLLAKAVTAAASNAGTITAEDGQSCEIVDSSSTTANESWLADSFLQLQLDAANAAPGKGIKTFGKLHGAVRIAGLLDKKELASFRRFSIAAGVYKHMDPAEFTVLADKIRSGLPGLSQALDGAKNLSSGSDEGSSTEMLPIIGHTGNANKANDLKVKIDDAIERYDLDWVPPPRILPGGDFASAARDGEMDALDGWYASSPACGHLAPTTGTPRLEEKVRCPDQDIVQKKLTRPAHHAGLVYDVTFFVLRWRNATYLCGLRSRLLVPWRLARPIWWTLVRRQP